MQTSASSQATPRSSQTKSAANGIVFLDQKLANKQAMHVLVVGVGCYRLPDEMPDITISTASARAIASWFIEANAGRMNGVDHLAIPLGSLALCLSEEPEGALSSFADVEVPRATLTNVRDALDAWVARAKSCPDNMLVLFIAAHGFRSGPRTFALFEEYGTVPNRMLTEGVTDLTDLATALDTLALDRKLLVFDCCRTESDLLNSSQLTMGTSLFNTANGAPGAQAARLWSTQLDRKSWGRTGCPTFHTAAVLDGLSGLASDPNDNNAITTSRLAEFVAKRMELHAINGERMKPESTQGAAFPLAVARERETVALFLGLDNENDYKRATIEIAGANPPRINGRETTETFARFEVAAQSKPEARVSVQNEQTHIERFGKLYPPAAVRVIKRDVAVREVGGHRSLGPRGPGLITVRVEGGGFASAVVTLTPGDHEAVLDDDGTARFAEVAEGDYTVSVALANGRRRDAHIVFDGVRDIEVEISPASQSEEPAMSLAAADAPAMPGTIEPQVVEPRWNKSSGALEMIRLPDMARIKRHNDGWPIGDLLNDRLFARTTKDLPGFKDRPLWLRIGIEERVELVAIPSIGHRGRYAWWFPPVLRVDRSTGQRGGSFTYAEARSDRWRGLLAFLGERNFAAASVIYRELVRRGEVRYAMSRKVDNPIAATAAALVAVQTGALSSQESALFPDQWLSNLCNWFPGLPDPAVVLARHLQTTQPNPKGLHEARRLYHEAFERGVPIFSLALTWLAEGLERLDRGSEAARAVRDMNWMQDPDRVFTVLRLPREENKEKP